MRATLFLSAVLGTALPGQLQSQIRAADAQEIYTAAIAGAISPLADLFPSAAGVTVLVELDTGLVLASNDRADLLRKSRTSPVVLADRINPQTRCAVAESVACPAGGYRVTLKLTIRQHVNGIILADACLSDIRADDGACRTVFFTLKQKRDGTYERVSPVMFRQEPARGPGLASEQ